MQRMNLFAGMKDHTLAEKSITEELNILLSRSPRQESTGRGARPTWRPHNSIHKVEDKLYQ